MPTLQELTVSCCPSTFSNLGSSNASVASLQSDASFGVKISSSSLREPSDSWTLEVIVQEKRLLLVGWWVDLFVRLSTLAWERRKVLWFIQIHKPTSVDSVLCPAHEAKWIKCYLE